MSIFSPIQKWFGNLRASQQGMLIALFFFGLGFLFGVPSNQSCRMSGKTVNCNETDTYSEPNVPLAILMVVIAIIILLISLYYYFTNEVTSESNSSELNIEELTLKYYQYISENTSDSNEKTIIDSEIRKLQNKKIQCVQCLELIPVSKDVCPYCYTRQVRNRAK